MLRSMTPLWLQTPAQLPNHLRSFRQARGLTQAALGALTGLDQTRIAKIERDPKRVSFGQLLQLLEAHALGVTLDLGDASLVEARQRTERSLGEPARLAE